MKEKELTDTEKRHDDMFRDDEDQEISVNELWQKWKRSKGIVSKDCLVIGGHFVKENYFLFC